MKFSEIIGRLKEISAIGPSRKQTIWLNDVASFTGDFFANETVKIYICDSEASKVVDKALKETKRGYMTFEEKVMDLFERNNKKVTKLKVTSDKYNIEYKQKGKT